MHFTDEPAQLVLRTGAPSVLSLTVWLKEPDGRASMDIVVTVPGGACDFVLTTVEEPFQPAELLRVMQVFSQLVLDSVAPFPPGS